MLKVSEGAHPLTIKLPKQMYLLEKHPSRGRQPPCPSQPEGKARKSVRQWRTKSLGEIHWLTWSTCRWNLSTSCHGSTVPIVTGWPPWSNTITPCSAGQSGGDQDIKQILLVALSKVKRMFFLKLQQRCQIASASPPPRSTSRGLQQGYPPKRIQLGWAQVAGNLTDTISPSYIQGGIKKEKRRLRRCLWTNRNKPTPHSAPTTSIKTSKTCSGYSTERVTGHARIPQHAQRH